jgi:hypothetical protein
VFTPLLFAVETLKLPFAIAGAVFVAWAALVAGFGLARPNFPRRVAAERAVIAVSVLLAAVAMGVAVQVA